MVYPSPIIDPWSPAPSWRRAPDPRSRSAAPSTDAAVPPRTVGPSTPHPSSHAAHDLAALAAAPSLSSGPPGDATPRRGHAPTGSLSLLDEATGALSALDEPVPSVPRRARARAGTMPSRFGAPGAPVPHDTHRRVPSHQPMRPSPLAHDDASDTGVPDVSVHTQSSADDTLPPRVYAEDDDPLWRSVPSMRDSLGLDALYPSVPSLTRTFSHLDVDEDHEPMMRERAATDTGITLPSMPDVPGAPSAAATPPPLSHTPDPWHSAPSSGMPGRASSRLRSGTIAALGGADARQRGERDVHRTPALVPDTLHGRGLRLRSNSAQTWAGGSVPGAPASESAVLVRHLCVQVTTPLLLRLFEPFGMIQDIQRFPAQSSAHIQYEEPAQALQAVDAGRAYIGSYLVELLPEQTVLPTFSVGAMLSPSPRVPAAAALLSGADAAPTRVVHVSSMPPGTTPALLMQVFGGVGAIEHVAVQPQGAQLSFEHKEQAQQALLLDAHGQAGASGVAWPWRVQPVREEDVWPRRPPRGVRVGSSTSVVPSSDKGGVPLPEDLVPKPSADEQRQLLGALHYRQGRDPEVVSLASATPRHYEPAIPMPADGGRSSRRMDHAKYRELRKALESHQLTQAETDQAALQQLDVLVDLSRNYIGNTVVQRFFEQCSEATKTTMLEILAPHLASIGTHKNGTWAAQKIIDCARTDAQKKLITEHLQPYVPALLLDQFGNYVVQCVLPFGFPWADFIYDAMVDRCWEIAQGRFGARSMRTCLEHPAVPREHIKRVALAVILHAYPLATNANGALLLVWLIESSQLDGVPALLVPQLVPHMAQLCTHKLASSIVMRLLAQTHDPSVAPRLRDALFDAPGHVLEDVLLDPVHGALLISRALQTPCLDQGTLQRYSDAVAGLLRSNELVHVPAYRRLAEQVGIAQDALTHRLVNWDADPPPLTVPFPPIAGAAPPALVPDTSMPQDGWAGPHAPRF